MKRRICLSVRVILASVMVVLGAAAECINVEPPAAVADLMESACIACHANGSDSGLDLESLVFDLSSKELFALWVQVLDMVESGEMPPLPEERPDAKVLHEAINALSSNLRNVSLAVQQKAGHVPARRLTKLECRYAVQDLPGIEADVTASLPEESESGSFDTVGKSQRLSAVHMKGFLKAADEALTDAIRLGRNPHRKYEFDLEGSEFLNSFHEKPIQLGGNISLRQDEGVVVFRDVDNLVRSDILGLQVVTLGTYQVDATLESFQAREPVTYKVVVKEPSGGARIASLGDLAPGERRDIKVGVYLRPGDTFYITLESDDTSIASLYLVGAKNFKGPGLAVRSLGVQGPVNEEWPPKSTRDLLVGCELQSDAPGGPFRITLKKSPTEHVRSVLGGFAKNAFRRPIAPACGSAGLCIL